MLRVWLGQRNRYLYLESFPRSELNEPAVDYVAANCLGSDFLEWQKMQKV